MDDDLFDIEGVEGDGLSDHTSCHNGDAAGEETAHDADDAGARRGGRCARGCGRLALTASARS